MENQMSMTRLIFGSLFLLYAGLFFMEYWTWDEQIRLARGLSEPVMNAWELKLATPYLIQRSHFMQRWWLNVPLLISFPIFLFLLLRKASLTLSSLRERIAGMKFKMESHSLKNHVARKARSATEETNLTQQAWIKSLDGLKKPLETTLLGIGKDGTPITMSDRQRSMHMQVIGYTGSGKTQSVLFPMMYQDAKRAWLNPKTGTYEERPIAFIDAKGSIENEEFFASIAASAQRLDNARIFSLNPGVTSHTYNPLYISPSTDPRQVAERVFSTFEFEVQYYRDLAQELWVNLICALASTGKQMTMLDVAAAITSPKVMHHALSLASDSVAVKAIKSRYKLLEDKIAETYMGLLTQVNAYDHPAINVYNPDIILEDTFQSGGMVCFSLNANAYKVQAKAIGLIAMQDIQHVGAGRQLDRRRAQTPAYVYADEFYNFAYEGFTDAVNKLRDANVSMALFHQSMSDLNKVSPEFAQGIWDSTRNRVILFQSDPTLCDNLAASVGTRKSVAQTVRRSTDGYLNQQSMLESSTREVDEFILHPNKIKHLRLGQAYLVQTGLAEKSYKTRRLWQSKELESETPTVSVGVNLALMPTMPPATVPKPPERDTTSGLGLHNMFIER